MAKELKDVHIIAIALAVALFLGIANYNHNPFPGGDNYAYLLLARSLRQGKYVNLWSPDESAHKHFPMGYPLILAATATTVEGAKRVSFIFWAGFIVLWWWWLKKRLSGTGLLCVMLLTACSPPLLRFSSLELSEMPFLFFSMLAIILYEKHWLWGMLMAGFCILIRPTGMALVLAMGGWSAYKRKWWALAVMAALMIVLRSHTQSEWWMVNPYEPRLGNMTLLKIPGRVLENLWRYLVELSEMVKWW